MYLDDLSGNTPALIYNTGSASLTNIATLTGLSVGQTYIVTVTAVNQIGESVASNQLTINAGITPSQITSLTWEASTTISVTVKWILPASNGGLSLTKFSLYYDIGQTGVFTETDITNTF